MEGGRRRYAAMVLPERVSRADVTVSETVAIIVAVDVATAVDVRMAVAATIDVDVEMVVVVFVTGSCGGRDCGDGGNGT